MTVAHGGNECIPSPLWVVSKFTNDFMLAILSTYTIVAECYYVAVLSPRPGIDSR